MGDIIRDDSFSRLKDSFAEALSGKFPLEGKKRSVRLNRVWVDDDKDPADYQGQLAAKIAKRSWTVPVYGDLSLVDNQTGKVIDRQEVRLASLPAQTDRYTYIHKGNEYTPIQQFRLRPAIYVQREEATNLPQAHINTSGGRGKRIRMHFDPETRKYRLEWDKSNPNLYTVLKTLGVTDADIKKRLGEEVFEANKATYNSADVRNLYSAITGGKQPKDDDDASKYVREYLSTKVTMDPKGNQTSLGKPHDTLTGAALLDTADKILKVSRGEAREDSRESLASKSFNDAAALIPEAIARDRSLEKAATRHVDKASKVTDVVKPSALSPQVGRWFTNGYAELGTQLNPVDMLSTQQGTTLLGPGGITSEFKVPEASKFIDSSQFGFLDPINTPEKGKTGVTLKRGLGVYTNKNGDLTIKALNAKTGRLEELTAEQAQRKTIAFPDEGKKADGKIVFNNNLAMVRDKNGDVRKVSTKEVDYILPSASQTLSISTNLTPFLNSTQGTRASMASRQLEQAIPLENPEAPLVQVETAPGSRTSFEEVLGSKFAHPSPTDGVVTKVTGDGITIKQPDGKLRKVQLYDNFPLQDKRSFITATDPLVKPGDTVKAGQPLADSNFTKNGTLAIGTNLRVAVMPYFNKNFEDGTVISETAAKKLTSVHMHREEANPSDTQLSKQKFTAWFGQNLTTDQIDKLDDDAVIKPGTIVNSGDVVIGGMKNDETTQDGLAMKSIFKFRPPRDASVRWDHRFPGEVVRVEKPVNGKVQVHIRTKEPAVIGDKIVNRYANKNIITQILPDDQMPKDSSGRPVDMISSPTAIPTRINPSQILEMGAAKVAEKTGAPLKIANFDPNISDGFSFVEDLMKKNGIADLEPLKIEPRDQVMKPVNVGNLFVAKQQHLVEKKHSARAGGPGYAYTMNRQPRGGGGQGGQSMDAYGYYSMLAHGARENIREMQTYKGDMSSTRDNIWTLLKEGQPLPPPSVPFAYEKMEGMLRAAGVDTQRKGNQVVLTPLTDQRTKELTKETGGKKLPHPERGTVAKNNAPQKGGLFDPGYVGYDGTAWTYFDLPKRIPSPVFQKAVAAVMGIKEADLYSSDPSRPTVMSGQLSIAGKTGVDAIEASLKALDIDKELAETKNKLTAAPLSKRDDLYKKVRYLEALKKTGQSPVDAYMQKTVAVLPANMRPHSVTDRGDVIFDDTNDLYKIIGIRAKSVAENLKTPELTPEDQYGAIQELYEGVRDLALTGATVQGNRKRVGVIEKIAGPETRPGEQKKQPKEGYFQNVVMSKRQDLSARSTIVPENRMDLDEVGIPKKTARVIFEPFIIQKLKGWGYTPLQAQKMLKEGHEAVDTALEDIQANKERMVLLKRDPALHKQSVMAFHPKIVSGSAIQIHPLVTDAYNADFDGDTMSVFVPLTDKATDEAREMVPSKNLYNVGTGAIVHTPKHEAIMGLNHATSTLPGAPKPYDSIKDAIKDFHTGNLDVRAPIKLNGVSTTLGQQSIYNLLPPAIKKDEIGRKLLTDPAFRMDAKATKNLLTRVANENQGDYAQTASALNRYGHWLATKEGLTLGMNDIRPVKGLRDKAVGDAHSQLDQIARSSKSLEEKDTEAVNVIAGVRDRLDKSLEMLNQAPTNLSNMVYSGARGKPGQLRQIVGGPVMVEDAGGAPIPVLLDRSYAEGLPMGQYWGALHGARAGILGRGQQTARPGVIMKGAAQATISTVVKDDDCGTSQGISISKSSPDILDRYLAAPVKLKNRTLDAGTLITPHVASSIRNSSGVRNIQVRSPLKCEHGEGVCARCAGLDEYGKTPTPGDNIGIKAAQAIGEPLSQASMDAFHQGGTAEKGVSKMGTIDKIELLLNSPKRIPNEAALSGKTGMVTKTEKNAVGGTDVFIDGIKHFGPPGLKPLVKEGERVDRGQPITQGNVNPHKLLELTDMPTVQNFLTDEIHSTVSRETPIKRKHVEVLVRGLTNVSTIEDPGDSDLLPGQRVPYTKVNALNVGMKNKIVATPELKGMKGVPLAATEDWLARMQHSRIKDTLVEGALQGWAADLHGAHPVPALAYGAEFGDSPLDTPWSY